MVTLGSGLASLLYVPLVIFLAAQRTEPGVQRTLHFVLLLTLAAPMPLAYLAAYNVLALPFRVARSELGRPERRMTPSWRFIFVGWAVTTPFLAVGFAAVSLGYTAAWVVMLLGIGAISALFPLLAVFKAWRDVSFLMRHLPARRRARETLRQEVLRLVGEHGAIGINALAAHLGMEPQALEAEVSALMAGGQLPVFHDRVARRLVHRACAGFDTRCPTCGGALTPSRRGLSCAGCGHVAIALRTG